MPRISRLVPGLARDATAPGWIAATLLCLALGCDSPPRAPALRNGPVYQHQQLGFRFLVPDGWKQLANANLPLGPLEQEICVAQFQVPSTGSAALEVLCFDRSYAPDLPKYHGEPSQGISNWTLDGEPAPFPVEGAEGERLVFLGRPNEGEPRVKEVVSFVRGERVVSFVASSPESDVKAREELRRATQSLLWGK